MGIQFFDVVVRADSRGLAKLLEHVNTGGSQCQLMNLHPVRNDGDETSGSHQPRANKTQVYVGGKRNKGIRGKDLLWQTITKENRPYNTDELVRVFEDHGFAKTSVWGSLSLLKQERKVRSLGNGTYVAIGTTVHMGATANPPVIPI